jgi:magnesium chelatase family protein
MNPCPCGHSGDPRTSCRCTAEQIQRYHNRVSGPLMDRIDVHVEVPRPEVSVIDPQARGANTSADVRERVMAVRARQAERQGWPNAHLDVEGIRTWCRLGPSQQELLETAAERLGFSPRACHRVLKVARTIADLEGHERIDRDDLGEAIGYRRKNRALSAL